MILFIALQSLLYFSTPEAVLAATSSTGVAPPISIAVDTVAYKNDMTKCAINVRWIYANEQSRQKIEGYNPLFKVSTIKHLVTVQEAKNGGKIIYNSIEPNPVDTITTGEAICGSNYWINVTTQFISAPVGTTGGTFNIGALKAVTAPPTKMGIQPNGIDKKNLCSIKVTWMPASADQLNKIAGYNSSFWQIKYRLSVQSAGGDGKIYFDKTKSNTYDGDTIYGLYCSSNYWINVDTIFDGKSIGRLGQTYFVNNTPDSDAVENGTCPPRFLKFFTNIDDKGVTQVKFTWENNKNGVCDNFTNTSKENIQYKITPGDKTIISKDLKVTYPTSGTIPVTKTTTFTVTGRNVTRDLLLGSSNRTVTIDAAATITAPGTTVTTNPGTPGGPSTTATGTAPTSTGTAVESDTQCVVDCGNVAVNKALDAGAQIRNAMCKMQCSMLQWIAEIVSYMFTNILTKSIM